jgi:hypothetical protein
MPFFFIHRDMPCTSLFPGVFLEKSTQNIYIQEVSTPDIFPRTHPPNATNEWMNDYAKPTSDTA